MLPSERVRTVRLKCALAIIFFMAAASSLVAEMRGPLAATGPASEIEFPAFSRPVLVRTLANSGRIFSGTFFQIEHHNSDSSSALATTVIRLKVEEAIRGVQKGEIVEVKEWAGLWQAGERYRPGERVLLFLYPPSKLGLTSPVGRSGRLPVNNAGRVLLRTRAGGITRAGEMRRVVAGIRQAERE